MKNFLNKKVLDIKPSGIRKFFDVASEIKGAISLGVGEPDFDTPWHIREEGIYSLEKGKTYYTSNSGLKELRIEITNYYKRRFNLEYDPLNQVLVTVGGSEAIDVALRAMIEPGDDVLIATPCYVSYEPCAIMAGANVITIDLKNENNFKLTKEELEKAITPKTKVLIINYPNNPTGAIMEKEDYEALADVIIKNDIIVISDEIYNELTYNGKAPSSIAQIEKMKERTIIVNGFSKAYSMTGWRLGYALGPKEILQQMIKIHQFCIMCAPTNSQYAGIEALKNGDKDISFMRDSYNERRRYLLSRLKNMGIDCFEPFGAFYVFPDIRKFGMSSEDFCMKLLETKKVVVVPGDAFGASGEGFVRISYAYSIDDLKIALDRIEEFIKELTE